MVAPTAVRAVTFDFWNTVVRLDGDSSVGRRDALAAVFAAHGCNVAGDSIDGALGFTRDRFDQQWRANRQYVLADAVADLLAVVGVDLAPGLTADLVLAWLANGQASPVARTEDQLPAVISDLRAMGLGVGVVCDSGLMPGSVLRDHLERLDLDGCFDCLAFSDEVGVYKPDPAIFHAAFDGLGVSAAEAVHVGDLYRTDVLGARAAGAMAVRYRGVVDDPEGTVDDGLVIDHLGQLIDLLDELV